MKLSPLFHWSPVERRDKIQAEGLRLYSPNTVITGDQIAPYICLSTTPSQAWALSGDFARESEVDEWDLWQVQLPERAETHVRPMWGDWIEEVKVFTPIPADHLWHVGTRSVPVFR